MKQVINNLLYDTETATIIYTEENTQRVLYRTQNGNFFMLYSNGDIVPKSEESAKEYLGKHSVPMYIELFGEPQEA